MNKSIVEKQIGKSTANGKRIIDLPVAIIGAGPVGLTAAAHLVQGGLTPLVFERGPAVGHALRTWSYVRVFSPWSYNIDAAAQILLEQTGWIAPDPEALPTGGEIVRRYLEPLAAHPAIAPHLVFEADVFAIRREGLDKMTTLICCGFKRPRPRHGLSGRYAAIGWKNSLVAASTTNCRRVLPKPHLAAIAFSRSPTHSGQGFVQKVADANPSYRRGSDRSHLVFT